MFFGDIKLILHKKTIDRKPRKLTVLNIVKDKNVIITKSYKGFQDFNKFNNIVC